MTLQEQIGTAAQNLEGVPGNLIGSSSLLSAPDQWTVTSRARSTYRVSAPSQEQNGIVRYRHTTHCRRYATYRLLIAGMPLRYGLSVPLPAEPVADGIPHHQLFVAPLEPGQLFCEHRHALPV
jgi:hypothetical protein